MWESSRVQKEQGWSLQTQGRAFSIALPAPSATRAQRPRITFECKGKKTAGEPGRKARVSPHSARAGESCPAKPRTLGTTITSHRFHFHSSKASTGRPMFAKNAYIFFIYHTNVYQLPTMCQPW